MPPTPSTPTYSGEYHPVDNVHTYTDRAGVGGIKTFLEQLLCISRSDHDPPACLSDRSEVVRNFGHNGSLDVRHWPALHKTRYWGKTGKTLKSWLRLWVTLLFTAPGLFSSVACSSSSLDS